MPKFLVRVSRAYWHSGDLEVTADNHELAEDRAREQADDVELKDWGDLVDLPAADYAKLAQDALNNDGRLVLEDITSLGELTDPDVPRRLTLEDAIRHAREQGERCQQTDPQCAADHIQLAIWLEQLRRAKELVGEQSEEDGLWFVAREDGSVIPMPEAMLQQALRALHAIVEGWDPYKEFLESYRAQVQSTMDLINKGKEDS